MQKHVTQHLYFSYSQEFPTRFRKDIVKTACSNATCPGSVSAEGIEVILRNIGAAEQMPRSEIESILREVCVEARGSAQDPCVISAEQMLNLLAGRNAV